jgi:dolichyl-phosphate beta-glucosyltransferase
MMKETLEYFQAKIKSGLFKRIEIVIVDDGSSDNTLGLIKQYSEKYNGRDQADIVVRGFRQIINQGKGAAVKYGSLYSRGKYILFADADGATDINDTEKIYEAVKKITKNELGCAIGCRNTEETKVQRKGIRKFLNWVNTTLVRFVLGFGIKDTQCGFKIFTKDAAKLIFPTQHLDRWAFDIELIFLCAANRIPIAEVPVTWQEIDGSHLNIVDASL